MLDRKSGDELTRNFRIAKFWGDSFWGDGNKCLLISDGAKMQTKEAILLKLHLVNPCACSGHGCKHRWRDTSSRRDSKAAATPEVHQPGWDLGKAALPSVELSACAAGMPTGREPLSGSSPVENLLSSAIIYCFYNLEDGPCDSCTFQLSCTCGAFGCCCCCWISRRAVQLREDRHTTT